MTPDTAAPASPTAQQESAATEPAAAVEQPKHVAPPAAVADSSSTYHARRHDLTIELVRLEQRLVEAEETRGQQGIGGPVSLIIVGSAVGTFLGVGALAFGSSIGDVKRDIDRGSYDEFNDENGDGVVDNRDLKILRRFTIAFSTVAIAHFGLAAFGTWWLSKRSSTRQRLDRELGGLEVERKLLQMKLNVSADANGAVGQLIGRF